MTNSAHFDMLRCDLMRNLPEDIPELNVDWFLQHLLPFVDHHQLSRIVDTLQPVIVGGRWRWYPEDPKCMTGQDNDVYERVQAIFDAVIDVAEDVFQKPATSRLHWQAGQGAECQDGPFISSGHQLLVERTELGSSNSSGVPSANAIAIWEAKKEDTCEVAELVSIHCHCVIG